MRGFSVANFWWFRARSWRAEPALEIGFAFTFTFTFTLWAAPEINDHHAEVKVCNYWERSLDLICLIESKSSDVGTLTRRRRTNRNTELVGWEAVQLSAKILTCGRKTNVFFFSSSLPGFTCSRKANGVELICFRQPFESYWLKNSTSFIHPGSCSDGYAQTSCIIFLSWVRNSWKWIVNASPLSWHWIWCERRLTM